MFGKQYIYLVAGLQEYTLGSDVRNLKLGELLQEVLHEFSHSDGEALRLLYGYYDCENLVAAAAGRTTFNQMGILSKDDVAAVVRGASDAQSMLPKEVAECIESRNSRGGEISTIDGGAMSFARELFSAYYESCAASKNDFVKRWSDADRNLRNVSAAITARVAGRPIADVVVGRGDVVDGLLRSSAVDFGLRGELTYLDEVIAAVSEEQNLVEKERRIDMVRWSIAEELAEGEYFSAAFVMAYLMKINIIVRWQMLDPVRGREMFERLLSELSGKDLVK